MSDYESCCDLFEKKNPRARALLSLLDVAERREGPPPDPQWIEALEGDAVCIWGISAALYTVLVPWLESHPDRIAIFFEDDLAQIDRFFRTPSALALFNNPQVHFYYIEDSPEIEGIFSSIIWGLYPTKPTFVASPAYSNRSEMLAAIIERFEYEYARIDNVVHEFQLCGAPFARNFWRNLFFLASSRNGGNLRKKFLNVPAVVVGAGPSLDAHVEQLRTLNDRALIFAGGSSVPILCEAGIDPHYIAGVDPNSYQYLRVRQSTAFEVPFCWRSRLFHEALNQVLGPLLYLRGGDGYSIAYWFEKQLGISGPILEGGYSICNLLIELAAFLGCSPIILVGVDLAYGKKLEPYASGLRRSGAFSETEYGHREHVHLKTASGKKIVTQWQWVQEAQWIDAFAEKHKRARLYTVTDSGMEFEQVPFMALDQIEKKFLQNEYDLTGRVRTALLECPQCPATKEKIVLSLQKIEKSFIRLERYLQEILEKKQTADDVERVLTWKQIEKEPAFAYFLEGFHRFQTKLVMSKREFFAHPQRDTIAFAARLEQQHMEFLINVCRINRQCITHAVQEARIRGVLDE